MLHDPSMIETAPPPSASQTQSCPCGSGLRYPRCCGWTPDIGAPAAAPQLLAPTIARAHEAFTNRDLAEAERLCLDVLELLPREVACLKILAELHHQEKPRAAEALFRRLVTLDPDDRAATCNLAVMLIRRGAFPEAEIHARNAVRLAPEEVQPHSLLGIVLTETNRAQSGEYHYRRALELMDVRDPHMLGNLAWNLKAQGKMDAARQLYREATDALPDNLALLLGFARLEEADRKIAAASALLDRCETLDPSSNAVRLQRAVVHGRARNYDAAIATLETLAETKAGAGLGPEELLAKGRLLDRMGRFEEAFEAFIEGKRRLVELSGHSYLADVAVEQASRLKNFFVASRLAILPRATGGPGARPIFIVGFPRSGTTLVEQMLSAHSAISAGDELPFVNEIVNIMPRLLASPLAYPEALAELWMGDRREALDDLRDHYLRRVARHGVIEPGIRWFTDKMPLNETHLGLISMVFPRSPIIHVLRHPLDVVLSVVSNQLTHGHFCAYALQSAASHYALIFDLVEHYKAQLSMRYLAIRYEDIVDQQRDSVDRLLDFIGEPFEASCLSFEENRRYARTASYAQVTEKLYDTSRYRYRHYRSQLEPVLPILAPAIEKLGYPAD